MTIYELESFQTTHLRLFRNLKMKKTLRNSNKVSTADNRQQCIITIIIIIIIIIIIRPSSVVGLQQR